MTEETIGLLLLVVALAAWPGDPSGDALDPPPPPPPAPFAPPPMVVDMLSPPPPPTAGSACPRSLRSGSANVRQL